MKHAQFKEWLNLSVVDELKKDERELLDAHLLGCPECREELRGLRQFQTLITGQTPLEVSDRLLNEARQQLHRVLLEQRMKRTVWEQILEYIREVLMQERRLLLAGTATALLGLFIGYLIFSAPNRTSEQIVSSEQPVVHQAVQTGGERESFTQGETRTSNVRFMDSNAKDGTIEFSFDAVTPMHVRGNVNDSKVQKVLARALTNEDNVGVRLRSVSAMASHVPDQQRPDPEVKAALISALKGDENPGVRQEALRVLLRYFLDAEIKHALLYTLMHDKNSGIRIAAINSLASASMDGNHMDQDILNVLKQKIQSDNNNYVRRQARTVMEEVAHR